MPIQNTISLPQANALAALVARNNTPQAAPPPPGQPRADFGELLKQANALAASGRLAEDAAVGVYFKALSSATSHAETITLLQALPQSYGYRDITNAALGATIRRAGNRAEALTGAQLAWDRGHAYDRFAIGALNKALAFSTTPAECLEIARLAREHDFMNRYNNIQAKAIAATLR
jgi:hypothetical protein